MSRDKKLLAMKVGNLREIISNKPDDSTIQFTTEGFTVWSADGSEVYFSKEERSPEPHRPPGAVGKGGSFKPS